jgi:organic radical activating enzyme
MNNKQPTDNKQLRLYKESGAFYRYTVEEVIANQLNHWKGWHCSAGVRGLYIDYDGNVWVANCASANRNQIEHTTAWKTYEAHRIILSDNEWQEYRQKHTGPDTIEWQLQKEFRLKKKDGWMDDFANIESGYIWHSTEDDINDTWGLLGTIFNGWTPPETWTQCPYDSCGCGADVILSKVKDGKYKNQLHVTQYGNEGQHNSRNLYVETEITSPTAIEMNFPIDYQILWDLSRRCNHSCSYCWPSVHNTTDPWHELSDILKTIDKATEWSEGESIRWNFGGGEPTIYPKFIEILKYLKEKGHWTMITTNGSRTKRFWEKACQYVNTVNFSCHFEEVNIENFIENVQVVCQHHDKVNDDHWVEIKLMAPAGVVAQAIQLKERIEELPEWNTLGANNRQKGAIAIVPIRTIVDAGAMSTEYTSIELETLRNQ